MAPPAAPPEQLAADVTRPLRALAIASTAGLLDHIGRDPSPYPGRHLISAPERWRDWRRVLLGTEPEDYVLGYADGRGQFELSFGDLDVPELIEQDEAAQTLGISVHTVIAWARDGKLEVVYFPGRFRRFFAAQVFAIANHGYGGPSAETFRAEWARIRAHFSLGNQVKITTDHVPPAGKPLPFGTGPDHHRAVDMAIAADRAGWTSYRQPGEVLSGELMLRFEYPGHARVLPSSRVPAYLLGLADSHGPDAAALIAYRKGLI